MNATLAKDGTTSISIDSVERLQTALKQLESVARQKPFMADLTLANGDTLSIGLGRDVSVLSFVGRNGNPPYCLSVGDQSLDDSKVIEFDYRDHWSEFPLSAAIPTEHAKKAILHFYGTGNLPSNIEWVES